MLRRLAERVAGTTEVPGRICDSDAAVNLKTSSIEQRKQRRPGNRNAGLFRRQITVFIRGESLRHPELAKRHETGKEVPGSAGYMDNRAAPDPVMSSVLLQHISGCQLVDPERDCSRQEIPHNQWAV